MTLSPERLAELGQINATMSGMLVHELHELVRGYVPRPTPAGWMDSRALVIARQFTDDGDTRRRARLQCAIVDAMQAASASPENWASRGWESISKALDAVVPGWSGDGFMDLRDCACAAIRKLPAPAAEPATAESAEPVAWPKVRGCGRDGSDGTGRTLNLFLAERPSDEAMRAIHDALLCNPTPAASDGGLREALAHALKLCRCGGAGTYPHQCSRCDESRDDHVCRDGEPTACRNQHCAAARAVLATPPTEQAKPAAPASMDCDKCGGGPCKLDKDGNDLPVAAPAQVTDAELRAMNMAATLQQDREDEAEENPLLDRLDNAMRAAGNALLALRGAPKPEGLETEGGVVHTLQDAYLAGVASVSTPPAAAGVVVELRLPDDGNGDDDSFNRGWNACVRSLAGQQKEGGHG